MIRLEAVSLRQGSFALQDIELEVPTGAYGVLMGATGAGKTSLLEAICGLRPVERGRILLGDTDCTGLRPALRGVGYVPQEGVLFPTMTVAEQLEFPLRLHHWPRAERLMRVGELLELLCIRPLAARSPAKLSGGERQRVALGRALAARPTVLCLDEPLAALDESTHGEMLAALRALRDQERVTTLHVTHSGAEADALGDVRLRLEGGTVHAATPAPGRSGAR